MTEIQITARKKVLSYLSRASSASAREVARALRMSPATVRHHLRVLTSDGRLEMTSQRRREGRGRPEKVYSIPRATFGDNLSALAEAVWTEAGSVQVDSLAKQLAGDFDFKGQIMTRRLHLVVEKLNQMKYHARWEAGAGGPRILFGHCPYATLLKKRPELCKMDAALLKELSGDEFEQVSKIENNQGLCVFVK